MKAELKVCPTNIDTKIINTFQICYPDAKINMAYASTIEKVMKKLIKNNDYILSMYNFIFTIESSVMTYLFMHEFCLRNSHFKKIYNVNLDKLNLTYYMSDEFNDKEKVIISGILKKIETLSSGNDKENYIFQLLHILPLCTNITYNINISLYELYRVFLLSKHNHKESNQLCQLMFDLVNKQYPKLFNDNLVEVFKQNKE